MPAPRPFSLVRTGDQWLRAAHDGTFLDVAGGVVELAWALPETTDAPEAETPPEAAGLAFDPWCRLFRAVPDEGRVERILWAASDPLGAAARQPAPADVFEPLADVPMGDFRQADAGPLREPRGVAVDEDGRLFVAESGAGRVLVFDLWSRRLLRAVHVGGRPVDLGAKGGTVWIAVGAAGLLRMEAKGEPRPVPLHAGVAADRVAVCPGGHLALLAGARTEAARVHFPGRPGDAFAVPRATDVEWETCDTLVVARFPGEDLLRFRVGPGTRTLLPPFVARNYDGTGIVRTPDRRIAFWTGKTLRYAVGARLRYDGSGRVTTFRLDSGEYQTPWGRIFVDACIPKGTSVHVSSVTTDEAFEEAEMPRAAPRNVEAATLRRPDLSPPMPPLPLLPAETEWRPVHRRESGPEVAWARTDPGGGFVTYEAPVIADPGRYLWVRLELRGNTRLTPRVRAVRAERPAHDLLRRIPRTFSREPSEAAFLRRYLAIFDGLMSEMDVRAAHRRALLDPRSAPEEMLPWLASFVGLTLDGRWSAEARRTLVEEAVWLFRFRGTVPGLKRFLEIYLGYSVVLVEKFRVRGLGGAIVGEEGPVLSRAIIGAGFRVGGALGEPEMHPVTGTADDAFRTHAHRFSVIVPGILTEEQRAVVEHVMEVHRPAHTVFDVCTAGAGIRVGRGLHVGISSIVGRTAAWEPLQVGESALGRGAVVGRPLPGTRVGTGRLGSDSRSG